MLSEGFCSSLSIFHNTQLTAPATQFTLIHEQLSLPPYCKYNSKHMGENL